MVKLNQKIDEENAMESRLKGEFTHEMKQLQDQIGSDNKRLEAQLKKLTNERDELKSKLSKEKDTEKSIKSDFMQKITILKGEMASKV